jgi:carbamoyltransferase
VALNCVANGRLLREGVFDDLWVQPAAGDAGGALGAALLAWYHHRGEPREPAPRDGMGGSYLGPSYTADAVRAALDREGARYAELDDGVLLPRLAELLAAGKVVGWFQGRMEFGPRALGGRSILADPRDPTMQSRLNLAIKFRESFRPFAPAVLAERVGEWLELDRPSPYMLLVARLAESRRRPPPEASDGLAGLERLRVARSDIPAVTHVDSSARVQTVHADTNPRFHALLRQFERVTDCPVLVNTSFNVRGEPIVESPADAWRCFMRTHMDALVVEQCLLLKEDQPPWQEVGDWRQALPPD